MATKAELLAKAKELGIKNAVKLNKTELEKVIADEESYWADLTAKPEPQAETQVEDIPLEEDILVPGEAELIATFEGVLSGELGFEVAEPAVPIVEEDPYKDVPRHVVLEEPRPTNKVSSFFTPQTVLRTDGTSDNTILEAYQLPRKVVKLSHGEFEDEE